jgi:hypothetical protein
MESCVPNNNAVFKDGKFVPFYKHQQNLWETNHQRSHMPQTAQFIPHLRQSLQQTAA